MTQSAGGLGDALLGLCAVRGLKKRVHDKRIVYAIPEAWVPFVALFDGGYDGFGMHEWDRTFDIPHHLDQRDLQLNAGYATELARKAPVSRIERYCRNLGGVRPELPPLRDSESLRKHGRWFAGMTVLAPYSAHPNREWPLRAWQTLEQRLKRTVVLMPKGRPRVFHSQCLEELSAPAFAGLLLNCACVISNDSAVAHMAGILGTRTVVICGATVGTKIFNFYPNVTCLQGNLQCTGCFYTPPYDKEVCEPVCASCASVSVDEVVKAATRFA